ncbi:MAG: glycoside hydrolase family 127 protein [Bacteroidales bacterium]|nr:glycoside hydrolase family 127 protein [Bacteroidales bacterium]MCM1416149.1 glycoside hydrolase family 127 protein [bacterium]MCM1422746.1 glycoside hydrolase family 127 protein [bacterium]
MADLKLIKNFTVGEGFFGRYEKLVKDVVLPYQERALNDQIEGAEKSHCIENFRMAAKKLKTGSCDGEFYGMVFQDSDVAKWLEGAAYSLAQNPDAALEKRCDEIIDLIGQAQHEDGYLNTYFTVKAPEKRWTNLHEAHELYCAGHMIEAAVAYAECTGKTRLLEIMCGMADHIYRHFIEEGAAGYPGHPEIELALMRLYRCTKNEKYKELALHFINVRGVDSDYYKKEMEKDSWRVWGNNPEDKEYAQYHAPVRQQDKAVGHAVRAVYLYTGMADAAAETKDQELAAACKTLWNNITQHRMYVTGAIGSAYEGEAFTKDDHLPNDTAYAETCAAIGLIFFSNKMLSLERNGKYADVMERALYNCVLAGMQLDGTKFFYVNPLEVLPGISGEAQTHRHALPVRPKWFTCACCPPNVARLLGSVAEYAWRIEEDALSSNLYIAGTLDVSGRFGGKVVLETQYPYDGKLTYRFAPQEGKSSMTVPLMIRIPAWSGQTKIFLNGKETDCVVRDGYADLKGEYTADDVITVELDLSVKRVYTSSRVSANTGRAALQRGPLLYCAEGIDNENDILSLSLKRDGKVTVGEYLPNELFGIQKLYAEGYRETVNEALYSFDRQKAQPCQITFVPYYTWGNRGLNQMRVWIPERD